MTGVRTTNFDAVAASAPLDRQASVIRDGSGEVWEAKICPSILHFKAPPQQVSRKPRNKADLTGRVYGRLTVVRYHTTSGAGRGIWLLRCVCGDYELRRGEKIREYVGDVCCAACRSLDRLRASTSAVGPTKAQRTSDAARLDRLAEGSR